MISKATIKKLGSGLSKLKAFENNNASVFPEPYLSFLYYLRHRHVGVYSLCWIVDLCLLFYLFTCFKENFRLLDVKIYQYISREVNLSLLSN